MAKRAVIVACGLAVIVAGVLLVREERGCSGSFDLRYVSSLSAIVTLTGDADGQRQCELIAQEFLDLEAAAGQLALGSRQLRERLDVAALASEGLDATCRISYRGRGPAETEEALQALVQVLVNRLLEDGLEERARILDFARKQRAEMLERRRIATSPSSDAGDDERRWSIDSDVEGWSAERFEDVLAKFESLLEAERREIPEAACVDYLELVKADSSAPGGALALRCRESRPVAVTRWPALSGPCRAGEASGETRAPRAARSRALPARARNAS